MSDDRKGPLGGLGDFDWDEALDEWEKTSFAPEIARDAETDQAASPLGGLPEDPALDEATTVSERTSTPPSGAWPVALPEPSDDRPTEGTLIAASPVELREESAHDLAASLPTPLPPRGSMAPPSMRGGLDQLFSRAKLSLPPDAPTWTELPSAEDEGGEYDSDSATQLRVRPRVEASEGATGQDPARAPSAPPPEADERPSPLASEAPSDAPSATPSGAPSAEPSGAPSAAPSDAPGAAPTERRAPGALPSHAAWLEEEARALSDPLARARALIALSELAAIGDDGERAYELAVEARELAPELPLAWRQARQLRPHDPDTLVEALEAEARHSPTSAARAHAMLLAADALRLDGRGDEAIERWESACKLDPADARAPIARAALALAQDDHVSGALRLSDNSELIVLGNALDSALSLRGVERPGVFDQPINEALRSAREALSGGDVVGASKAIEAIASVPELARGALWLSAAFGAAHIGSRRLSARALRTLAAEGEPFAHRQLAARGVELDDPELVLAALSTASSFSAEERAVLTVLSDRAGDARPAAADLDAIGDEVELAPLLDALAAIDPSEEPSGAAGSPPEGVGAWRELASFGRLLASDAAGDAIDAALTKLSDPRTPAVIGVALEAATRAKRWDELSEALPQLRASGGEDTPWPHVAAAILAERAEDHEKAKRAWADAASSGAPRDGLARIAAELDPDLDLAEALVRVAEETEDPLAAAVLRLEALGRRSWSDDERASILEDVHHAAPSLGLGAYLAERVALGRGDLDGVLRWIHERHDALSDPLELAIDAVREALLVADRDPEAAAARAADAHRARPGDVTLRELHERLALEPPPDGAAWREERAEAATGAAAAPLWLEAAREHERAGDAAEALRAARSAAAAGDRGLSGVIIERAAIAAGATEALVAELAAAALEGDDPVGRREALERLAILEAPHDREAALRRHRALLEQAPHHLPSLRRLEHELLGEDRHADLLPVFESIARGLDGDPGGECTAHAQHAARLRARVAAAEGRDLPSAWEQTYDMARLAAAQPEPSLWSLRALNAHARARRDEQVVFDTTRALLDRTHRPSERAALLVRASQSAAHLEAEGAGAPEGPARGRARSRALLEQAVTEDPGDVVTWGLLAELRASAGEAREAAEACESVARTSAVPEHQVLAWSDAAKIWLDEVGDTERGMSALEAAAELDPASSKVFARLSEFYRERHLDAELARLLERRLATVEDEDERIGLTVELARTLSEMGELAQAKDALSRALAAQPSHTAALGAYAEACMREGDYAGAEQGYVQLARLLADPADQRATYERLGEIYAVYAPNLPRAEAAYKEVLKRSPGDLEIIKKLVEIHKRQGDTERAAAAQKDVIAAATDPDARLAALIELAAIHETVGRDLRKSEQVLDSTRKEYPTSVVALRAMAEFYARQRQTPAMHILLDRSAADARRAFAQGRFVPSLFQLLHAAFELRGKHDAARVVAATLAAVEGHASDLSGADARAFDPRLDDLLAPDAINPPLRALLHRTGGALDAVAPLDLRLLKAAPLPPGNPLATAVGAIATVSGLGALEVFVSPHLGRVAVPLRSSPPAILVGEALANVSDERARSFVIVRAMKMIVAGAGALLRGTPEEVSVLVASLLMALNPGYAPPGVDPKRAGELIRRVGAVLPRNLDPTVGVIALEAAGMLGARWATIQAGASTWANRVALLAVGEPSAALDAIAWGLGEDRAPAGSEERAAWIARHAEARDLMTFSVTDAYAEARARLGLER